MVKLLGYLATLTVAFICVRGEVTIESEFGGSLYFVDKQPLNISCHGTDSLNWLKNDVNVNTLEFDVSQKMETVDGTLQVKSTVSRPKVSSADSAEYKCRGENGAGEKSILVKIIEVTTVTATFNHTVVETILSCKAVAGTPSHTLKWMYKGKDVVENAKYKIIDENTLMITNAIREDAGEYQCILTMDNGQKLVVPVEFFASPYVRKMEKSRNLIQGDPLTLKCKVIAHPNVNVTWYKDGKSVDGMERIIIMDEPELGVPNGKLRIEKVEFEDKGEYMCIAYSALYNISDNGTTVVRVKDKLAALWPFLGIVAEVVVLCIIIFIYEKKRNKSEENDDSAGANNSVNAVDHKGDVRQRNVKA